MKNRITLLVFAGLLACFLARQSHAQQVRIDTPFNTVTDDYYERVGVGFGFTLPASPNFRRNGGRGIVGLLPNGQINPNGINFTQGSVNSALPPFGGFDPAAQGQFGFAVRNGSGGGFNLNLFGGKGNSRTLTSQTPSIVVPNGVPGVFADQTLRPFVTGITPVVGSFSLGDDSGPPISPVDLALQRLAERGQSLESLRDQIIDEQRQARSSSQRQESAPPPAATESTAAQGALSVAEIKRQRAAELENERQELQAILDKVDRAEQEGHYSTARSFLNQAIRKTSGSERRDLERRYAQLKGQR